MEIATLEKKELYIPVISEITRVEELTATEKRFTIRLPEGRELNHKPGQFVEVSILAYDDDLVYLLHKS